MAVNSRTILGVFFAGLVLGAISAIVVVVVKTHNFGQKPERNQSRPYNYGCAYGKSGKYCDMCGITSDAVNVRVIGGVAALPHSFPAQAYIKFSYEIVTFYAPVNRSIRIESQFVCGGTLINRDTIVTAAHCVPIVIEFEYKNTTYKTYVELNKLRPTWASMFTVYLGMHDVSAVEYERLKGGIKFNVAQVIKHPDFNENNCLNDIAVLKLESEVELSSKIQLACLPDPSKHTYPTNVGAKVYGIGWGVYNKQKEMAPVLQNVNLTYLDESKCTIRELPFEKDFTKQICAGDLSTGKDTCDGDSGSGLYMLDAVDGEVRMVAIGIVSYGYDCGENVPAVYTRMSAYLAWIDSFA